MQDSDPPKSVVVGIDGSKAAVEAALWAIDEAVSRDIPLRLLHAIDPREAVRSDPDSFAHRLATAEIAIRYAFMAVEASQQLVKIEVEILHGNPVTALTRASQSAAMVCVGAVASPFSSQKRVGSTASALASAAHCPVAIVRGRESVVRGNGGWIVVALNQSPRDSVLVDQAVEEARLREAPVQALTTTESRIGACAVANEYCHLREGPDSQLADWIRCYPDVDIRPVALGGSVLDYLTEHARSVKLVVVGADDPGVGDRADESVLQDSDSPLLVVRA
jgi:nucleotide-binding universal stress UspA family protein